MKLDNNERTTMSNNNESSRRFVQMAPALTWALVITALLIHTISQGLDLMLILGLMDCSIG